MKAHAARKPFLKELIDKHADTSMLMTLAKTLEEAENRLKIYTSWVGYAMGYDSEYQIAVPTVVEDIPEDVKEALESNAPVIDDATVVEGEE